MYNFNNKLKKIITLIKLILIIKIRILKKYNNELIIFDEESKNDLDFLLEKKRIYFIPDRAKHFKQIDISIKIIKNFIKNYRGNIKKAYQIALIETIKPKIVLTFIDTNWRFSELAKIFEKTSIKFVAIQNGARFTFQEYEQLYRENKIKTNINKKIFIPKIFTLGDYDKELSKKYNIKINNFLNAGSLRLYNFYHYKKFVKKEEIQFSKNFTYDLTILSDYEAWDQRLGGDYTKKILDTVNQIIKISIKNKLKCVFLFKSVLNNPEKRQREIMLYKNGLDKNCFDFISDKIVERSSRFGSYEILLKSNLLIGVVSTLLRENIALGGKSLACNLTPGNIYDFPLNDICSIKNFNFDDLEKRILYLIEISRKNYHERLKNNKFYLCNPNYKDTKNIILKNIN